MSLLPPGEDSAITPDQSKPHVEYIKQLLSYATGKDKDGNLLLTRKDLSKYSSKRRADARSYNKDFSLTPFQRIFGSAKLVIPSTIFCSSSIDESSYVRVVARRPS
jgi:hypothetical protein